VSVYRDPRRLGVALLASAAAVAVVTAAIQLFKPYVPVLSLGVLYVFAVLPIAVVYGLPLALVVSVSSMLAFNWFHLPPIHTFTLADSENWFALAVYFATAVVVSELAARARRRAAAAEQRFIGGVDDGINGQHGDVALDHGNLIVHGLSLGQPAARGNGAGRFLQKFEKRRPVPKIAPFPPPHEKIPR